MKVIFDACKKNNGTCIVANNFVLQSVPEKHKLDNVKLDVILKQLEYDGYFECTKSQKDGATVNVIALKQTGTCATQTRIGKFGIVAGDFCGGGCCCCPCDTKGVLT